MSREKRGESAGRDGKDAACSSTKSSNLGRSIQDYHPGHTIAFCETGWPTSKVSTGDSDEARLVKARVGETEQEIFVDRYDRWVEENRVISFYFTSFDAQWKGGFDGVTPEKKMENHRGLHFSDRTPKKAMQ